MARITSLVAPCSTLLTPLCASRASFLTPFCAPRSPFLTPLGTRLRRICGRRRRGGRRGGLGFSLGHRQKRRRSDQSRYSRASKESERAASTELFRLRTFPHTEAPGFLPCQSIVTNVESLVIDLDQLRRTVQATLELPPIDPLGRCGLMVPTVTINPSLNLVRAKSLGGCFQNFLLSADVAVLTRCHLSALQR